MNVRAPGAQLPASAAATVPKVDSQAEARRKNELTTGLRKAAAWCGAALIFVRFSAIHEVIAQVFHIPTYLLYPLTAIGLAGVLLSNGMQRAGAFRKPLIYWMALYGWIALGVPFSAWPGGAF